MTAQPENSEIQARVSLAMKVALDACPSPRLAPFTPAQMAFLERVLASALSLLGILNKTSSILQGQNDEVNF